MPIRTTCPNCRAAYTLADDLAGKKVRCKNCDEVIAVRGAAPAREAEQRIQKGSSQTTTSRVRSEEEEPARPRRRTRDDDREPRPRKKGRSSAGMMIGLGVGVFALVLVCGGIVTAVVLWGRSAAVSLPGLVDDLSGPWPEPGGGPMGRFPGGMAGGMSVTVHVAGVGDEFTREAVEDKLIALIDRGNSSSTASSSSGDRMTIILTPVKDPRMFASRIDFAKVKSVDDRLITIIAYKVDGPSANADSVTKGLFRLKSSSSRRRAEGARQLKDTLPDERRGEVCKALEPLLSERETREIAIEALGVWGTRDTTPLLLKVMREKDTRVPAIRALGRLKDERAIEPIAERLEDGWERGEAMEALKKFGPAAEEAVL